MLNDAEVMKTKLYVNDRYFTDREQSEWETPTLTLAEVFFIQTNAMRMLWKGLLAFNLYYKCVSLYLMVFCKAHIKATYSSFDERS